MSDKLDERVDKLERALVRHVARINAHEKFLFSAFAEVIMDKPDPIAYISEAKRLWTERPSTPARIFANSDPAYLDLISAESDSAIADMLSILEAHVRGLLAAKSGHQ